MLEQIARHGAIDLQVKATGDVEVDGHHTTEDVGIVLGTAVLEALGNRAGIRRHGSATLPMDEALVASLRLRNRLLLYIYSLAGWTTQRDYKMLRLLAFDFRDDPNSYDIRDQFMFGPAFLVCPVTQPTLDTTGSTPVEHADKSRSVYLPTGCDWWDFWTDARLPGGQRIEACLLYTSPSPRDRTRSRMPSSA